MKSAGDLSVNRDFLKSITNMVLRGLTLLSKFVLMLLMARALSPEDVGLYGLFAISVNYALFLIGLDFYTFSAREILSRPRTEWPLIIRDQACFQALVYLLVTPCLLILFCAEILPWHLIGWFYLLMILEHMCQEGYRLLVVLERPLLGGVVLFLRFGMWAYLLAGIFWFYPDQSELNQVWWGWSTGGIIAALLIFWGVSGLDWSVTQHTSVDWRWIRRGLKVAFPFLAGTLAQRGMYTFDRYVLDMYMGRDMVGVYTLFMGMALALQSFVDSGIVVLYYPKLVKAYRLGDQTEGDASSRAMGRAIIILLIVGFFCAFWLLEPLILFAEKAVYIQHTEVFWLLALSISIAAFSLVYHYRLYAFGQDRLLMKIALGAFAVFIIALLLLTPSYGMTGVCMAHLIGSSALLGLKYRAARG